MYFLFEPLSGLISDWLSDNTDYQTSVAQEMRVIDQHHSNIYIYTYIYINIINGMLSTKASSKLKGEYVFIKVLIIEINTGLIF